MNQSSIDVIVTYLPTTAPPLDDTTLLNKGLPTVATVESITTSEKTEIKSQKRKENNTIELIDWNKQ